MNVTAKTKSGALVRIRDLRDTDRALVIATWLRSYRDSALARQHSDTVYYARQASVIDKLLGISPTYIACDVDSDDVILGWLCGVRTRYDVATVHKLVNVVHYLYVKHAFRGLGIARSLCEHAYAADDAYVGTHRTSLDNRANVSYDLYLGALSD